MNRRAKLAVVTAFGLLGLLYIASIAAAVIRVSPSGLLEAVFRVPDFVVLLVARIVEALGCGAIVALSFGTGPRVKACAPLAVILAFGGAVILIGDALTAPQTSAVRWAIALVGIALHLWGAFWALILSSNESAAR